MTNGGKIKKLWAADQRANRVARMAKMWGGIIRTLRTLLYLSGLIKVNLLNPNLMQRCCSIPEDKWFDEWKTMRFHF